MTWSNMFQDIKVQINRYFFALFLHHNQKAGLPHNFLKKAQICLWTGPTERCDAWRHLCTETESELLDLARLVATPPPFFF